MKICITSSGPNLDSFIDPRFGRCLYFIFVDDKNPDKFEAIQNTGVSAMRGAGITAAQIVVDKKAEIVISGNFGPNAFEVLSASGVKILRAKTGIKAREALEAFKQGQLSEMTQPFGGELGHGRGGGGMGRGGGFRAGRGRGRGRERQ